MQAGLLLYGKRGGASIRDSSHTLQGKTALVTGAAGFIGSSLSEHLLNNGCSVVAVDKFTHYYDPRVKRANLASLQRHSQFSLREVDVGSSEMSDLVSRADVVFHLAAQPGVRSSWGDGFVRYVTENVLATQQLLETVRGSGNPRLVFSSSSSVYGSAGSWPSREDGPTLPHSPYGVTKLASEHLCRSYAENWGLQIVILRLFTVYGPRQRPDMAIYRLLEAVRTGESFTLMGDGTQRRDFTYVGDVVAATIAAALSKLPTGTILNVSGGSHASLLDVIGAVEKVTGQTLSVCRRSSSPGDVHQTSGSRELAKDVLGWEPTIGLQEGIAAQWAWHLESVACA